MIHCFCISPPVCKSTSFYQCIVSNRIELLIKSPEISHLIEEKEVSEEKKLLLHNVGEILSQFYKGSVSKKGHEVMKKIAQVG